MPRPETTAAITRGMRRHLADAGVAALSEVALDDGRRADLVAITRKGDIWIIEVKSSLEDFRTDRKWADYHAWCDRLFFAVSRDFPAELIADECGLFVADEYGASLIRDAAMDRLPAARRKAMMLRLARLGAARLFSLSDPDFVPGTGAE